MLNTIIRFSLRHRLLIAAIAVLIVGYGTYIAKTLPIDVFPDLNRPRVTVMTEAGGMAPEEVEAMITIPIESVMNGAMGVQTVRSASGVGMSIVTVEFDWGTDIYIARQTVNERLALAAERIPSNLSPQLTPISSIMGQILMIGIRSETGETSQMELRTLADWVVTPRIQKIAGISQVMQIGGERKQFQVLINPASMLTYGVTLAEIESVLEQSDSSVTGGYIDSLGPNEYLVRGLGRIQNISDLQKLVVTIRDGRAVLLEQVATVSEGAQIKRGDASVFVRKYTDEQKDHHEIEESPSKSLSSSGNESVSPEEKANPLFVGGPAVVLNLTKQPGADTRLLTEQVKVALVELQPSLPKDVRIDTDLYQQKTFIDLAINNVMEALRDGGILVAVVLFLFLLNFRTTLITLTAIPISVLITALVFHYFGLSINTMTLGGIAVAIGELVDDAIVDVENIFRRLRENDQKGNSEPALRVIFHASCEIRNSIVFSTMIIVIVFIPLFALSGMEGRFFVPLGIAYMVSIASSLLVSLTVTPVLSYWLLPRSKAIQRKHEGFLLSGLQWIAAKIIRFSLRLPKTILLIAGTGAVIAIVAISQLEQDFLPPFDEGVAQLNVMLPPGTSLARSKEVAELVEARLQEIDGVRTILARTGRAEMDEHVIGANMTEFVITFDTSKANSRSREEVLADIREAASPAEIPGIVTAVEQPLAHLISAMLSGVQSQVAIKIFGDDLDVLRNQAENIRAAITSVPGVTDLMVEPQTQIPQIRIQLDRDQLARYGLAPDAVNQFIETAMNGRVVKKILLGQRTFDLFVRLNEDYRDDLDAVRRLSIELPDGGSTTLGSVADIFPATGPNTINREQVRRRIVVQCNVAGRGLVDVVREIQARIEPIQQKMPTGYFVEYGGQFESQQSASHMISILFILSLLGMFLILYTMFRSANLAFQVMTAIPMALIGSVASLFITHQTFSIASMVGFISLCGIATRNGILLIDHYLHLMRFEDETFNVEMIVRAGKERLAPALMTAITAGFGLIPLAMAAGQPGKEILYPVATVIIGGLISSTVLEFFVRPALFWTLSRRSVDKIIENDKVDLI